MVEPAAGPLLGLVIAVLGLLAIAAAITHTYLHDRKDPHR